MTLHPPCSLHLSPPQIPQRECHGHSETKEDLALLKPEPSTAKALRANPNPYPSPPVPHIWGHGPCTGYLGPWSKTPWFQEPVPRPLCSTIDLWIPLHIASRVQPFRYLTSGLRHVCTSGTPEIHVLRVDVCRHVPLADSKIKVRQSDHMCVCVCADIYICLSIVLFLCT